MDNSVNVTKDMIKGLMYFILLKYEQDDYHNQGISNRSDYIGGFIDRWISRAPEFIIFNELLFKNKDYKAISDYFIYDNTSDKNSPDIIGIKDENCIIKFCQFNNNTWEKIGDKPYIEVKTFKQNQNLVSIRAGEQLEDNDYYVIVESNFRNNYLNSFFESSLFDKSNINLINVYDDFIYSNTESKLKIPNRLELAKTTDEIGELSILGIIKGSEISKLLNLYDKKETAIYLKNIREIDALRGENKLPDIEFEDIFPHKGDNFYTLKDNINTFKMVRIHIENTNNITIKKVNQKSIYIIVKDVTYINGEKLESGKYKLELEYLTRSSQWKEYITTKSLFKNNILPDSTEDLIELFDKIYEDNIKN